MKTNNNNEDSNYTYDSGSADGTVRHTTEIKALERKVTRDRGEQDRIKEAINELRDIADKAGVKIDESQIEKKITEFKELFEVCIKIREQIAAEGKRYKTMEEELQNTVERVRLLQLGGIYFCLLYYYYNFITIS